MNLEYIVSGVSICRLGREVFHKNAKCVEALKNYMTDVQKDYAVSYLFNAYSEVKEGIVLHDSYSGSGAFKDVYSDSGGLQMITLGVAIDDAAKDTIYSVQGKHSTVAMSFDEIPVITPNGRSAINDNSERLYVCDMMEAKAIKSGQNLDKQIEAFKATGTMCKPMLIAQGNCRHTIAQWVDIVYNTVKPENREFIHGIAFAFSSLGNGMLESVEVCAAFGLIPYDRLKKNIHLLGVGSIKKLVPFIECFRSGYIPADVNMSFDSTSFSQAILMGRFTNEKLKTIPLNKTYRSVLRVVYDEISPYLDTDVSYSEFEQYTLKNIRTSEHLSEEHRCVDLSLMLRPVACMVQVKYFMDAIRKCYDDPERYADYISPKLIPQIEVIKLLAEAKDVSGIESWFDTYSKYVESDRIRRVQSLEQHSEETITLF